MPIVRDNAVDIKLSGPVSAENHRYIRGTLTLVAGTASITIPAVSSNAQCFCSIRDLGGTVGTNWRCFLDAGGVTLTITSSNALDTSTMHWLVID